MCQLRILYKRLDRGAARSPCPHSCSRSSCDLFLHACCFWCTSESCVVVSQLQWRARRFGCVQNADAEVQVRGAARRSLSWKGGVPRARRRERCQLRRPAQRPSPPLRPVACCSCGWCLARMGYFSPPSTCPPMVHFLTRQIVPEICFFLTTQSILSMNSVCPQELSILHLLRALIAGHPTCITKHTFPFHGIPDFPEAILFNSILPNVREHYTV